MDLSIGFVCQQCCERLLREADDAIDTKRLIIAALDGLDGQALRFVLRFVKEVSNQ